MLLACPRSATCMNMASWTEWVLHWKRKLEKGVPDQKVLEILGKLQRVPITVEILQETGIGKVVNNLKKQDGEISRKASKVITDWKQAVCADATSSKPSKTPAPVKPATIEKPTALVKPQKQSYNEEQRNNDVDNKYLSKNSHSSQKKNKYNTDEDTYDPSSSMDDYRDFKQKDPSTYNPTSTKEDYRKYVLDHLESGTSTSNGEYYHENQHNSKYLSQDSDQEEETVVKHKHSESSRHSHKYDDQYSSEQSSQKKSSGKKRPHESDEDEYRTSSKVKSKSHTSVKEENHHRHSKSTDSKETKVKESKRTKSSKPNSSEKGNSTEDGFNNSMASFEACLGFNDNVVSKIKVKPKSRSLSDNVNTRSSDHHNTSDKHKRSVSGDGIVKHPKKEDEKKSSHKRSKHKSDRKEMPEALKKPKLKVLDQVDILSTLPEIQPEYKPRVRIPDSPPPKKKATMTNEEAIAYTSSRKDRTALYTGRKHVVYTEVPSLQDICVRVLCEHIDEIGFTGGVPYDILKPILEKCSPAQLYSIEDSNIYLLEDTNDLWEVHLKREFKFKKPEEGETWRDLYLRLYDEREAKLKSVTANISASMAKATPVRQTKLAYVDSVAKPPRNVARKQARYGTGLPVAQPMKAGPPGVSTPRPNAPVINSANASRESSSQKKTVIKVAPLMQKTLKFMKNRFRR